MLKFYINAMRSKRSIGWKTKLLLRLAESPVLNDDDYKAVTKQYKAASIRCNELGRA